MTITIRGTENARRGAPNAHRVHVRPGLRDEHVDELTCAAHDDLPRVAKLARRAPYRASDDVRP